jgi:hypothetical protein
LAFGNSSTVNTELNESQEICDPGISGAWVKFYGMANDGIARAAQALGPSVAKSFFKTGRIHLFDVQRWMFDVR